MAPLSLRKLFCDWLAVCTMALQPSSMAVLTGIGLTDVDQSLVDRVKGLPNHHCLYKTFDVGGEIIRAKPFFELRG